MKKQLGIFTVIVSILFFTASCELFEGFGGSTIDELTTAEVVQGLKKALEIGTDSSTTTLSVVNGFYLDKAVKILLPPEAEQVRQQLVQLTTKASSLSSLIDLDGKFEDVVRSLNRAAEEAAKDAQPIFVDAITSLSIQDGWNLLNGINPASQLKVEEFDSTAATQYFKVTTSSALQNLFAPKMDVQLNKNLGLGFSANQAWTALRNAINNTMNTIEGNYFSNLAYINSGITVSRIQQESIGNYATERALDGLFHKVGNEEKKIRKNPYDWAISIIQKVFGSVMNK